MGGDTSLTQPIRGKLTHAQNQDRPRAPVIYTSKTNALDFLSLPYESYLNNYFCLFR